MPDSALTEIGPSGAAELARFASALWRGLPGWPQTPGEAEARMRLLLGAGYRAFLLHVGDAPVAYALTRDNGDHVFIRHFVVAEGWTRQGLGSQLLQGLDERFDHPEFRVSVLTGNAHLMGFWRRTGFAPDAVNLARPAAPEED